jgi:hypothetical protein
MSTKTMKQRIALVAVSAMGFGLLSIAPAHAAAISADEIDIGSTALTAVCSVAADKESATVPLGSFGVVLTPLGAAGTDAAFLSISGPAKFTAVTAGTGGTGAAINSLTTVTLADIADVATPDTTVTVTPTAIGTVSISISAASGTATLDTLTLTVVASCANSDYSATTSFVQVNSSGTAAAAANNVDVTTSATAGNNLFIQVIGKNAYSAALTAGTYAASATNGALINWGARGAVPANGAVSSAILTPPTGDDQLRVTPASTALGATTTVTITHNGTPVATKTLTFHAEAASIVIGDTYSGIVGTTGAASTGYIKYSYKSAAGATVPSTASALVAASQTAIVPAMTQGKAPGSSAGAVTGIAAAQVADIGSTTDGVLGFDCAKVGTSTVTIATVNTVTGATITSPVTVSCTTGIDTYTVSTDKAAYRVGEVATITITAKDSTGNLVSDATDMTSGVVSVGGGSLTKAVVAGDLFRKGVKTYTAQMTTAGAFNTVVSLPGTTKSVTAAYTVTDGNVSNAEVLKSIVALIASINKQIQALQKLILRR